MEVRDATTNALLDARTASGYSARQGPTDVVSTFSD